MACYMSASKPLDRQWLLATTRDNESLPWQLGRLTFAANVPGGMSSVSSVSSVLLLDIYNWLPVCTLPHAPALVSYLIISPEEAKDPKVVL